MSPQIAFRWLIFSYYFIYHVLGAPNIIFVLTDDQDISLASMQAMPNVLSEIANKGITFNHAYANTPVCCPSRTEFVSGRTYHNVKQSNTDCQGISATYNIYENPNSLFNKFHHPNNGYITGAFGKITNDMDFCNTAPDLSSFDRLHVSCDYRNFFTPTNFNKYIGQSQGVEETPTLTNDADIYQTAQLGNATVTFIRNQLSAQQSNTNTPPFIIWVAPYAPHSPADPAPWYQQKFDDISLFKTPNYNNDVSNYHLPLSSNPEITTQAEEFMLLLYKDRLRSLLSVDDMMLSIVQTVDAYDAWNNTYLVYTSDHGYHIGQYRLPCEKYQPYEETVRVPLYIRGPTIQAGETTDAMVQNIDLLPTLLDLAGVDFSDDMYDGRSFKSILETGSSYNIDSDWRHIVMFEYKTIKGGTRSAGFNSCAMWKRDIDTQHPFGQVSTGLPNEWILDNKDNNWRVLRIKNTSVNWFYGEFISEAWDQDAFEQPIFYEFYDMSKDPYQETNSYIVRDLDYLTDELLSELHDLVRAFGQCCGVDSCSPVGDNRPAAPAVCEGTSIVIVNPGRGGGGGKGAKQGVISMDIYGFEEYIVQYKNTIYFAFSTISVVMNVVLLMYVCLCKTSKKKYVDINVDSFESDATDQEV